MNTPFRRHVIAWIAGILLLFTMPLPALENMEIEKGIGRFEQGLSAADIDGILQLVKRDAVWQGSETYPYVEENLTELFNRYRSIRLTRNHLELSSYDQRIVSTGDYRLQATTTGNEAIDLDVSFIFLWEDAGSGWKIIALNPLVLVPISGSVEDDLKILTAPTEPAPSPTPTHSLYPSADSHVYAYAYSGWNRADWGRYEILGAGWHPTGGEKRAYLRFDLWGVDRAAVHNARLRLYHNHTGGGDALTLGVYRVKGPWTEGDGTYKPSTAAGPDEISWDHQPSFDTRPVAEFHPGPGADKWIEVEITPLVRAWLSGLPNYGLMIKAVANLTRATPESQYGFYSREAAEEKRPALVLSGPMETPPPPRRNAVTCRT